MSFPPAHMLVGAGTAEVVRTGTRLPRWRSWAVAAALAVVPDLDFVLGIALHRGEAYHGTFTHSIAAAVVVALCFWMMFGGRWGMLAGWAYGSHLLVDLLDDRGRTNVLIAWPFSHQQPLAIARIFPKIPFNPGHGMHDALVSLASPEVLRALVEQTVIGALFFAGLLACAGLLRALRYQLRKPRPG